MSATVDCAAVEDRLRRVLALHLDPEGGSHYWLDRAAALPFDPREVIRGIGDLPKLGIVEAGSLADRSLDDYVPRCLQKRSSQLLTAQTGGTTGRPVWTAYLENEFYEAFVAPFLAAAGHVGFPQGGRWLYVGPSGPHVIARAAEAVARAGGSMAPFTVDFDSRWARKLAGGEFAAKRYLRHVVDQAMAIIETESVDTIFTTPVVLAALAETMNDSQRHAVCGVHYGGMAVDLSQLREFQETQFPNAVHLAGYGNTLFGCCLELNTSPGRQLQYYPQGSRLLLGILAPNTTEHDAVRYDAYDQKGRVVFSRLDESALLVNVIERDEGTLIPPPENAPQEFRLPGLAAPESRTKDRPAGVLSLY